MAITTSPQSLFRYEPVTPYPATITSSAWVRPTDWLSIPSISSGEQVVYALVAVYDNDSNYIAFLCQGNYTVDWGDGSQVQNVSSNIKTEYKFTYSSLPANTTTSEGYRQALVKITPQAGQNLTVVNFNQKHSTLSNGKNVNIIDLVLNIPNVTGGNLTISSTSAIALLNKVKRIWIKQVGALTNIAGLFSNLYALEDVPSFTTTNVTNFSYLFNGCTLLKSAPLLDTSNATNTSYMFQNCYFLTDVPLYNLGQSTSAYAMFASCYSLQSIPTFNISKVQNAGYMFSNCMNLRKMPELNTSSSTNFSNFLNGCTSLTSIPAFNTANVTDMTYAFASCTRLKEIPYLNTSKNTAFYHTFTNCYGLTTVPLFDTSNVTNMHRMFTGCVNLITVPPFNTSKVTAMSGMFEYCGRLQYVPTFDTSNVTTMTSMFIGCTSLQNLPSFNTSKVTDFSNFCNGCVSIPEIPSSFDMSKNTTLYHSFTSCFRLKTVPSWDITNVNNAWRCFSGCISLQQVILTGSNKITEFSYMFEGETDLQTLNIYAGTGSAATTMFGNSRSLTSLTLTSMSISFNVANAKLSATAIDNLGNSVADRTGLVSRTVTLTGNPGTGSMSTAIWTNKNWTVVR